MKSTLDIDFFHALYLQSSIPVKQTVAAAFNQVAKQFETDGIAPRFDDAAEELIAAITAYHVACNHKWRKTCLQRY